MALRVEMEGGEFEGESKVKGEDRATPEPNLSRRWTDGDLPGGSARPDSKAPRSGT
jgi:hypothetical protein